MNRTYLYMHHDALCFFLRDRELTAEELYCEYCDASDTLIGCYDSEQMLAAQLRRLFEEGYDLEACDEYLDIKDKYCPPALRLWELEQFETGSSDYLAYAQRLNAAAERYACCDENVELGHDEHC